MNASLKRCVFNLDLNWESVSELEHMSGVSLSSIFRFVCVRSTHSLTSKANAPLMFRSRSPVNQIPLRSRSDIKFLQ